MTDFTMTVTETPAGSDFIRYMYSLLIVDNFKTVSMNLKESRRGHFHVHEFKIIHCLIHHVLANLHAIEPKW